MLCRLLRSAVNTLLSLVFLTIAGPGSILGAVLATCPSHVALQPGIPWGGAVLLPVILLFTTGASSRERPPTLPDSRLLSVLVCTSGVSELHMGPRALWVPLWPPHAMCPHPASYAGPDSTPLWPCPFLYPPNQTSALLPKCRHPVLDNSSPSRD